jgi:hypothetical protein
MNFFIFASQIKGYFKTFFLIDENAKRKLYDFHERVFLKNNPKNHHFGKKSNEI